MAVSRSRTLLLFWSGEAGSGEARGEAEVGRGTTGDTEGLSWSWSTLSPGLGASTGVWNEIKLKTEGDKLSEVHYS